MGDLVKTMLKTLVHKPKKYLSSTTGINNLFEAHVPEKIRMYLLYKNLITNMRLKVKNNSLYNFEIGYILKNKIEKIENFSIHNSLIYAIKEEIFIDLTFNTKIRKKKIIIFSKNSENSESDKDSSSKKDNLYVNMDVPSWLYDLKKLVLSNFNKKSYINTNKKKNRRSSKKSYLDFRVNRDSKIINNFKKKIYTCNTENEYYSNNNRELGWLLWITPNYEDTEIGVNFLIDKKFNELDKVEQSEIIAFKKLDNIMANQKKMENRSDIRLYNLVAYLNAGIYDFDKTGALSSRRKEWEEDPKFVIRSLYVGIPEWIEYESPESTDSEDERKRIKELEDEYKACYNIKRFTDEYTSDTDSDR